MFEIRSQEEVWANKTSLTPPLIIEVSAPTTESERLCICVQGILILRLSAILFVFILELFRQRCIFYSGIVPTAVYFLLSLFCLFSL